MEIRDFFGCIPDMDGDGDTDETDYLLFDDLLPEEEERETYDGDEFEDYDYEDDDEDDSDNDEEDDEGFDDDDDPDIFGDDDD